MMILGTVYIVGFTMVYHIRTNDPCSDNRLHPAPAPSPSPSTPNGCYSVQPRLTANPQPSDAKRDATGLGGAKPWGCSEALKTQP